MIKYLMVMLCLVVALVFLGCASSMPGAGGVFPGSLINATMVPGDLANIDQRYAAYPDSFQILGEVEGKSSNINVLSIISIGNGGYIPALEDARSKVGADGIINCSGDVKSFGILGLFSTSTTTVKGIAIKLK